MDKKGMEQSCAACESDACDCKETHRKARHVRQKQGSPLVAGVTLLTAVGAAAAAAWVVYSNVAVDHDVFLPNAVPAERLSFQSQRAGLLSYYVDRQVEGRPLVLIHSVNAAASAYEMGPLFRYYRTRRPVYALDLPGFGFSERSKREYSPKLYEDAILEFLEKQVGAEADVIALSLGSEFAARAALRSPQLFHSLTLLSPTGLGLKQAKRGSQKAEQNGMNKYLHAFFSFSLWGRPLYDLLTTKASIRYFLEMSFVGDAPPELIEYDVLTGHRPGAEHAPLHFISGNLFTRNVMQTVYEQVSTRTLVVYDRDAFSNFELLPELLAQNLRWSSVRIVPTLGLAQFEQLDKLTDSLDRFWEGSLK